MATAIATKPAPPHQKMKRPPPPAVQTSINGVRSSQSSPSPSVGVMRAPSGTKHPPGPTNNNAVTGSINSAGPRSSARRRDVRTGKPGQSDGANGGRNQKKTAEPYVKSTSYILKKYKKAAPSVVLHLHPTHFRFDQQDGSFSYNSPMRFLLEHLKAETVPHDIIDELLLSGVKFYEGCLIVQVHDHRSTTNKPDNPKVASVKDGHIPFSIHNHSDHLTPSPYAPWPQSIVTDAETNDAQRDTNLVNGAASANGTASGKTHETTTANAQKDSRKFTVVLFPTPLSMQAEVAFYATTADPRSGNRKQSTAGVPRTPASATMPHPPTPLSAVPPTPSTSGPANKKQKMLVGVNDIRTFESKIIEATAAPLYLEPAADMEEAQKIIHSLSDPRHQHGLPAPKTRKRTVAELAADEAAAAQEQRFMLIMDERLGPSASGGAGGKTNASDGDGGASSFEPRFERFKLIDQIRLERQAQKQREREIHEQRAAAQAANKARLELQHEQERQAREQQHLAHQEHQAQQERAKEAIRLKNQAAANHAQLAAAAANRQQHRDAQQAAHQSQMSQPPISNNVITNGQAPHIMSASQSHHSSPVVRTSTPHSASSPMLGHVGQPGGVPMRVSNSGQGVTSSPARPPSAMQHGPPQGGIQMIHQRSQQGPSRRGTPQMPNGTPSMASVTPVMPSGTPTSRMGHGSPPTTMSHTPVLHPNNVAAQHIQAQHITPEHQQRIIQHKMEQQRRLEEQRRMHQIQAQAQAQMQNASPQPGQMSPDQRAQQMAIQQARMKQQAQQAYQDQLVAAQRQQMAQLGSPQPGQPHPHGHPQQHPGQATLGIPRMPPQQPGQNPRAIAMESHMMKTAYQNCMAQFQASLQQRYPNGQYPPEKLEQAKVNALNYARQHVQQQKEAWMKRSMEQQQNQARMMAMQREMGGMNGMGGAGGQMGAMGMGISMNGNVNVNGNGNGMMAQAGMNGMGAQMGMNAMNGMNINGMGGVNGMGGGGGM